MNSMFRRLGIFAAVVALTVGTARAQDLGQQLAKLGSEAVKKYTTPLLQGFGDGMNTAFYHSADLHDVLGFDVSVKLGIVKVTDEQKTYTLDMPASITVNGIPFTRGTGPTNYPAQLKANTAVGDGASTELKLNNGTGTGLILPGGVNTPVAGAPPIPQLAVGLPFGLEVIGRFAPSIKAGDAGKYSYSGFGLRYDVDQWLPLFPIDIAVHFATQKMTFKDGADKEVLTAKGTAYGVEVSKKLIFITLYGGFQLESSTMTVAGFQGKNLQDGSTISIPSFVVKGQNKSRATVGLRLLLLIVNLQAEYSLAPSPVLGLGAGISIR